MKKYIKLRNAVGGRARYSLYCEPTQSRVPLKHLAADFKIPERTADVLRGEPLDNEGTAESEKCTIWRLAT